MNFRIGMSGPLPTGGSGSLRGGRETAKSLDADECQQADAVAKARTIKEKAPLPRGRTQADQERH